MQILIIQALLKLFCDGIIKKACHEIINEVIYADSTKNAYIDNIKSSNYIDSIKSICNDTIKNKFPYADSAKSACKDKIKSIIVNINYLDTLKSTYTDNVKSASTKITKQKNNITRVYCNNINNKSTHSKISCELSALLKIKKVSNTNIIIKKKLNPQAIDIKYELNMLNKQITQIIKGNKVHTQNNAYAKSAISIKKVHIENNTASNTSKKTHKKLFNNVLKQIKTFNKVHIQNNTASNTSKKT